MPAMGVGSASSRPLYHPPPCITTRRCALGSSSRNPPQALMASPAAAEGVMAATAVPPGPPPRRTPRLLLQTPRAPAPHLPQRHCHAAVDENCPAITSPTRTQRTHQVTRRRKRRRTPAPPGRAPATRHARTAATTRPMSAPCTAVSPVSLYLVNEIFCCKTHVSVMF